MAEIYYYEIYDYETMLKYATMLTTVIIYKI